MHRLWGECYSKWFQQLEQRGFACESGHLSLMPLDQRLAYAYFKPPEPKACTVLLHGTGNDALFGWQGWIEGLLAAGQAVLTCDLEGHGRSSRSWLERATFGHSLGAIESKLREQAWPPSSISICAYSLGALAAMKALREQRIRAGRLVILGMPLGLRLDWRFAVAEALSLFHPLFWHHVWRYGWSASLPAFGSWRRHLYPIRLRGFAEGHYTSAIADLFSRYDAVALATEIDGPSLLLYGTKDRLSTEREQTMLAKTLPAAKLVRLGGCNHFLLPWHPQALEETIAFIAKEQRDNH